MEYLNYIEPRIFIKISRTQCRIKYEYFCICTDDVLIFMDILQWVFRKMYEISKYNIFY